jgi:hypothetical protein
VDLGVYRHLPRLRPWWIERYLSQKKPVKILLFPILSFDFDVSWRSWELRYEANGLGEYFGLDTGGTILGEL